MDRPSRTVNRARVQPYKAQSSEGLGKHPVDFKLFYDTLLPENLGTYCCDWPVEKASVEVQILVKASSRPYGMVINVDGSVTRNQSGWGFAVKQGGRSVREDCGAYRVTTSSLIMGEEVTRTKHWLVSQYDTQITYAIIQIHQRHYGGYQAHLDPIWRLERAQHTIIFRLRTGHCGLSAHLKRIVISDTSLCEYGQADQTPDHVLQSCPNMPRDVS